LQKVEGPPQNILGGRFRPYMAQMLHCNRPSVKTETATLVDLCAIVSLKTNFN
jgi:hypothetical protein